MISPSTLHQELDRQVKTLLERGYPEDVVDRVDPLREPLLARADHLEPPTLGRVPFVVVVGAALVPAGVMMTRTDLGGRAGFADLEPDDLARFVPIPTTGVTDSDVSVALDVDRGTEFCSVTPNDAMPVLEARGRTPLTVAEGIALLTHHPEVLAKNACFSLAGSRCGDKRVPALWISNRAPKLGWCWAGNPHTWLGTASCAARIA